jgi:hypothetical protein
MKTGNLQRSLQAVAAMTAFTLTAGVATAQEPTAAPAAQPVAATQPAPELSYGVPQVLQLVQAKVSDPIIVNFVQNSGTIYALQANEIVYLKQQGMSDTVLNAMLNQRSRLASSTESASTTAPTPTASYAPPSSATQPVATYAAPAQSSTVYIIPDTQTYRYNAWFYGATPYYYYPNYGGYYNGWPAVSLSFGWGNYNYSGYHGSSYSGWHGSPPPPRGGYRSGGGGGGGHPPSGGGGRPPSGGGGRPPGGGGGHR